MPDDSVTLRACTGTPLADKALRELVISAARAIAERNGVAITRLDAEDAQLHIALHEGQIAAMGLASELRRTTNAWYRAKHDGATLWGEPPESDREYD